MVLEVLSEEVITAWRLDRRRVKGEGSKADCSRQKEQYNVGRPGSRKDPDLDWMVGSSKLREEEGREKSANAALSDLL